MVEMPKGIIKGVDDLMERKGIESGTITQQFLELKLKEQYQEMRALLTRRDTADMALLPEATFEDPGGDDEEPEDDDEDERQYVPGVCGPF